MVAGWFVPVGEAILDGRKDGTWDGRIRAPSHTPSGYILDHPAAADRYQYRLGSWIELPGLAGGNGTVSSVRDPA